MIGDVLILRRFSAGCSGTLEKKKRIEFPPNGGGGMKTFLLVVEF